VPTNIPLFETIVPNMITICTYTEFAPFAYEEHGKIVGSDILLLEHFAREMGRGVNIIKRDFTGLWHTPGNGACDVAAAGMAAHEDRDLGHEGAWSRPYMRVTRSLLIRRTDIGVLRGPGDFTGKKIVVTANSTAHIDAQERYEPLGANIIPVVPSQDEVVRQLLSHEIDAFGEGNVSNNYLAEKYVDGIGHRLLELVDIHTMEPPELLRFVVRATDMNLLHHLNEFIAVQQTE
jgi:ABC-type amino acid transport substrate-binding protein